MLKRFSTDIAKGVATVAGAKPPRTLEKMRFFSGAKKSCTHFHHQFFKNPASRLFTSSQFTMFQNASTNFARSFL